MLNALCTSACTYVRYFSTNIYDDLFIDVVPVCIVTMVTDIMGVTNTLVTSIVYKVKQIRRIK